MRANVTVVVELPVDLDEMLATIERVCAPLTGARVFQGSFTEASRDGTPAHLSFTVGGVLDKEGNDG